MKTRIRVNRGAVGSCLYFRGTLKLNVSMKREIHRFLWYFLKYMPWSCTVPIWTASTFPDTLWWCMALITFCKNSQPTVLVPRPDAMKLQVAKLEQSMMTCSRWSYEIVLCTGAANDDSGTILLTWLQLYHIIRRYFLLLFWLWRSTKEKFKTKWRRVPLHWIIQQDSSLNAMKVLFSAIIYYIRTY